MEKYSELKELLKNEKGAERFIAYCQKSELEKKNGQSKNPFFQNLSAKKLSDLFFRVSNEGLEFDGNHITLQSTGINYDYIAYKNKMLNVYPESIIDLQLVYKDDEFSLAKNSGKVVYNHEINNPFSRNEKDIIGGYCFIKNKRGEFITTLTIEDIKKHKAVAKTSYIWNVWFAEMCLKTVIKKAVKFHFDDVYQGLNEEDNLQYDLEKTPIDFETQIKEAKSIEDLQFLHSKMSEKEQEEYLSLLKDRKNEIQ